MTRPRLALTTLLLASSGLAHADNYRVDLLVFLNPAAAEAAPATHPAANGLSRKASPPDDTAAIAVDDELGLTLSGIRLVPEDEFALANEWRSLKAHKGYETLYKLAYTQNSPPAKSGPAVRVYLPVGESEQGLAGYIRLKPTKSGTLQVALAYQSPDHVYKISQQIVASPTGVLKYLDGGRLGVLAKLVKVGAAQGPVPLAKPTVKKPKDNLKAAPVNAR